MDDVDAKVEGERNIPEEPDEEDDRGWGQWIGPDRFGALLAVVMLTFITTPMAAQRQWGAVSLGVQSAVVVLLALEASAVSRRWMLVSAMVVGLSTVALIVEAAFRADDLPAWPSAVLAVLLGSTPFLVLRRVLRQPRVTVGSIAGTLAAYLLIGLAFGALYQTISLTDADAFSQELGPAATYFSFVTLVTLGYGDIVPVSELARSLATLEAVLGQVVLVTLVARSVTTLGQERPERSERPLRPGRRPR